MRFLLPFTLISLITFPSCKPENKTPIQHAYPGPPPVSLMDQDRDGISDPFEVSQNTSAQVANFPTFKATEIPHSEISMLQKDDSHPNFKWTTHLDRKFAYNYRPARIQIAKLAHKRDILLQETHYSLLLSPLSTIQLTQIDRSEWEDFKELKTNQNSTFYFNTTFNLEVELPSALEKVSEVAAQLGFFLDNQFIALTNDFLLKDSEGENIILSSDQRSTTIQVNLEIIQKDSFKNLIDKKEQIVLKIKDFKALTKEKNNYLFSAQWNYATQVLTPFLLSTPDSDKIFLVRKDASLEEIAKEISSNYEFSNHKTHKLVQLGELRNQISSQKNILKMTNEELIKKNWYHFKSNQSQSLVYLSYLEMAQASHLLISEKGHSLDKQKDTVELKLKIGETIQFKYFGYFEVPKQSSELIYKDQVDYQKYEFVTPSSCRERSGFSCYGNRDLEPREPIRQLVSKRTQCELTQQIVIFENRELEDDSLKLETLQESMNFKEIAQLFSTKTILLHDQTHELEITITEEFIQQHGESLIISTQDYRDQETFSFGVSDFSCRDELPRDFNQEAHFGDYKEDVVDQKSHLELQIVRKF